MRRARCALARHPHRYAGGRFIEHPAHSMVTQIETRDATLGGVASITNALYAQAVAEGMKAETLSELASDARTFSAAPRAVAFPYIPGGKNFPSGVVGGSSVYPATIDYHDATFGMSFVGGRTMPSRIFRYADYPVSRFNRPMPQVPQSQMPVLRSASASGGWLTLSIYAPVAIRAGAAIWADPSQAKFVGPGALPAGRAATVLVFDLKRGRNVVRYRCPACKSGVFDYSM